MSFKIIIQFSVATMFFLFSTAAAWYEGSTLVDVHWEWKHSAIFSQMMNGQVENGNDILAIDHFFYAAKFAPTFPVLMSLSGTYLIILLGYIVLKHNNKLFAYYLSCIGILSLGLSGFVWQASAIGLKIFTNCFLTIGVLLIVIALFQYFDHEAAHSSDRINKKIKELAYRTSISLFGGEIRKKQ